MQRRIVGVLEMKAAIFWLKAEFKYLFGKRMTAHEAVVVMKIRDMAKLVLNSVITEYVCDRSKRPEVNLPIIRSALAKRFNFNVEANDVISLGGFVFRYLADNEYIHVTNLSDAGDGRAYINGKGIKFEQGR